MTLNAQTKPPVYLVWEAEVTDPAVYKTYVDRHTAIVEASGGRFLSRGANVTALDGAAPKRSGIIVFDSMEKALAYRNKADFKAIQLIRDKSSKYRAYLTEGTVSTVITK